MNQYLIKVAKKTEAKNSNEHHDSVLKMLDKSNGVVAQHSMGSGKTLLALRAAKKYQDKYPDRPVVISAPASVIRQFPDEAKKFGIDLDEKRTQYLSHEELVNRAKTLKKGNPSLLIVDEGHRLRNRDTSKHKRHMEVRDVAEKALVMTGTAMYNKPHDLAALVNLASGHDRLPTSEAEFARRYIRTQKSDPGLVKRIFGAEPGETQTLKNEGELKNLLKNYVHNYDAQEEMPEEFAKTNERIHKVEISKDQYKYYRFAEDRIPWPIRVKIRSGLPLSKKESASLNAFSSGVRQISNSHASFTTVPDDVEASPKFQQMLAHQKEKRREIGKNYRNLVYSNYLESGLRPYSQLLSKAGIKHAVYTGELSKSEKKQMVDDYNAGKVNTLLVSSSGAEGLNLKGVRHVQVMEPHFNESKIKQVAARAVRRGSHAHLEKKDREVTVDHYHSELPKGFLGKATGKSIDEYLHNMSKDKEVIKDKINKLIPS